MRLKHNYLMKNQQGQAAVEYLLVLLFVVMVSLKMVGSFNDFLRDSTGNLGHVLSQNLIVGICDQLCFFANYENGFGQ
jgi:hypothetical protein